jgi:polyphosphate kinase
MSRVLDLPVAGEEVVEGILSGGRVLGMRPIRTTYALLRETYFDTRERALDRQGLRLCLRIEATGRQTVELTETRAVTLQGVIDLAVTSCPLAGAGLYETLGGPSEVATRVAALTDPAALRPLIALDIDRETRELRGGWFGKAVRSVRFDRILAHRPTGTHSLLSLVVGELVREGPSLESLAQILVDRHGLAQDGRDTLQRALAIHDGAPVVRAEALTDVRMALLIRKEGALALSPGPAGLTLPVGRGSGEDPASRFAVDLIPTLPDSFPELELVGFAPSRVGGSDLEVWLLECPPGPAGPEGLLWMPLSELLERTGGPGLRDPTLVAALLLLVRSETGQRMLREYQPREVAPTPIPVSRPEGVEPGKAPEDYLDAELSILDFNLRVLEMAEDGTLPLMERFRFLSIFASNMDEFFVVRVGRLKAIHPRADEEGADGRIDLSATDLLDLISIRVRGLVARHYACLRQDLLPALADRGIRIRSWAELGAEARAVLSRRFEEEIFPLLTPRAMAGSPGQPFPRLESLGLSLAAVLRGADEGIVQLAHVPVPESLPRFLSVGEGGDVVASEEVIAAHAPSLFPAFRVVEVHAFRVTRAGDVEIDEDASASLLASVQDEVEARPYKPVIRIEVQRTMPREVLAFLLRELRQEAGTEATSLGRGDVFEVDGPLDLRVASDLADRGGGSESFPRFTPRDPLPADRSIFEVLRERDVLVYHPFESFDGSVGRFLREASTDPEVVAIKLTLYRTGRNSPFADTLLDALRNGKEVSVFVELKARFDEESNIQWTRRIIEAGGHVVYGVVGYKTHAKTALVVRREGTGIRRYVHVGTGNYNAATARFYTDLGLLSADPDLGADLNDFFNELTGSSGPPVKTYRRILVAPNSLAQGLHEMVEREIGHARAGRPARIRAKMNGLTDRRMVNALYRASAEGVEVDLIVRAVCTLRPGVPGLSEGIRVHSILGRLLEHARIYYFENAGAGEYFIASADWRRRNLRKRVEVAVPVDDATARERLRSILDAETDDPRAWVLRPDGAYERRAGSGPTAQQQSLDGRF